MIEYLQNLTWQQQAAGGAALAGLVALYWKDIKKVKNLIPSFPSGGNGGGDTDVEDLQSLKQLQLRGERLECVEFKKAIEVLFRTFFWHDEKKHD